MPEDTKIPAKEPVAKKVKEPTIEEKPFEQFIQEHFLPTLQAALTKEGLKEVQLSFLQEPISLAKTKLEKVCSQVKGVLADDRQFSIYFLDENINGKKAFSYSRVGQSPSTLESFMIDERKSTLDILVLYTLQRLNGQKWLSRN